MVLTLFLTILFALFSAFGVYALLRLLYLTYFVPFPVIAALIVRQDTKKDDLPQMLAFARDSALSPRGAPLTALVERALQNDEELLSALKERGVRIVFTDVI